MQNIIDNLDIDGLESLWNATFTDPNEKFDKILYDLFDGGIETEEGLIKEMKEILTDEINYREDKRKKENDEFMESLMNIEDQPLISQPKQPKRRKHINEDLAQAIKEQHTKRQQHIDELHQRYDNLYPDASFVEPEGFYEWLRSKNAPADDDKVDEFINSIRLNSVIDFQQLSRNDRAKAFERMKAKLEEVIGELAMTEKFLIHFRINGQWKSRTLTPQIWNKLMDSLNKQEFIYGKEVFETSIVHFSPDGDSEFFKFVYFDAISFTPVKGSGNKRKDNRDSFFPYLNKSDIDLSRYQIFDSIVKINKKGKAKQRKELNDSCFVYALKQFGIDEDTLNKIRARIHVRKLGLNKMDAICEEFNLHVVVHDREHTNNNRQYRVNKKNYFGTQDGLRIDLNSYKNHYFLEEKTIYTLDYIKHKYVLHEEVPEQAYNKRYVNGYWQRTSESKRFLTSAKLIKLLYENNYFEPITYNNSRVLSTTLYKDINFNIDDLHYSEKHCTRLLQPVNSSKSKHAFITEEKEFTYFYADFEADVSKTPHKCYMCCVQSLDGTKFKTFKGPDCDKRFLNFMSYFDNPCIYFHNLKYDFSFLAKYGMKRSIQKGTRLMRAVINYHNEVLNKDVDIYFRDTVPILSCKLSRLPQMFHINNIQKEIFPYKYYTFERLESNIGTINEAGMNEDKPWTTDDYKLFNENIDKIEFCRIDENGNLDTKGNHFDMYRYAEFYCQQDVNILRQAFNKFASDFMNEFGINPFKFISISSLANEVFKQRVYYPNGNLYEVGGHVREFMAQAVYGGRCMTAYNKKWNVKDIPILDYDAVSLYPSAMSRLYTVEGRPEVLKYSAQGLTFIPDELSKYSAYVIEIKITKVRKHYPFPLIVQHTKDGNLNKDDNIDEEHPITMVVDNIYLEDLVEFQKITFDVIRGYTWSGKKDYRIQEEIKKIFNKRLEYKKQDNPLQELYKLIMNSCYGKCIEKPVMKESSYVKDTIIETSNKNYKKKTNRKSEPFNPYLRYIEKHYEEIIEDVEIGAGVHQIKRLRPTDTHFNNSLLGIQILSMSKRIMNEVLCLAYDIGCHVFYIDTDSIHVFKEDLDKLEKAFREKYGSELKGKNLGQFHSDFPLIPGGSGEIPFSIHSIFIAKKIYLDVLIDSSGKIYFMFRGKGLTQESINATAERYGGLEKLYEALYNGEEVKFDLAEGAPSFLFNKDFTVSSNESFIRKVKAKYVEGKLEEYFNY